MKFLKFKFGEPLPAGEYSVYPKETDFLHSAMNGHSFAFNGECTAKSDGRWVKFYVKGKRVFSCNANYAAYNFLFEEKE